jgi:ribosome recycling factor
MPEKASVKKTTKGTQQTKGLKPAKKTVKKTAKKVTWDDVQAGFRELQELHKETERTLNKAIKETEKTLNKAIGA